MDDEAKRIVKIASKVGEEGFENIQTHEVQELLQSQELTEEDLKKTKTYMIERRK